VPRTLITTAIAAFAVATVLSPVAHADDAVNLPLTPDVRAELIQAGAVLTGRPASEFTGLREGQSYYAVDPETGVRWAAAALHTDGTHPEAAIQLQDQNSYMSFRQPGIPGATWIPTAIGFGPIPAGQAPCPIPEHIRALWNWPAGKCYRPRS
jgi:hypothetical protein